MKIHYKMFKKGKNWCYMAMTTVLVATGAFAVSQSVSADVTDSNVGGSNSSVALVNTQETASQASNTVVLSTLSGQSEERNSGIQQQSIVNNNQAQLTDSKAAIAPKATSLKTGWQTQNGSNYYYKDGQKLTGQQQIDGKDYYFNDQGQQQKDYFLNQNNHTYYFQKDGIRLNDGFYNNWGHTYYFQKDGARLDNGFYNNWGHTYYFGKGGVRLDDGFYNNWGHTYYFQKDGARLDNGFYNNWGHTYYFGEDGARWDNRWYNNWGHKYFFGEGGVLLTNTFFNTNGSGNDYDAHWADGAGIVSDVHYFSQYTPVFAPWGCAGASLAMLLSIKNVYPNLYDLIHNEPNVSGSRNQGWNGGQSGDVTTGAGFDHVIQPNALSKYGKQFYNGVRDISYTNLSKIAQIVQSGHPVLYYGWSAYDAGGNRNHCKVILGYNSHNNTFHVYDPLYGYRGRWTAHSTGKNAYDLGYNAWVPAKHIQGEMNGQALSIY